MPRTVISRPVLPSFLLGMVTFGDMVGTLVSCVSLEGTVRSERKPVTLDPLRRVRVQSGSSEICQRRLKLKINLLYGATRF